MVFTIFEDKYLNFYYWRTLNSNKTFSVTRSKHLAQQWFQETNVQLIVDHLLDCIYLARCQLVHGAATYDSKLNRDAVRRCGIMLDILIKHFLLVVIDHGLKGSWDNLCYPPISTMSQSKSPTKQRPR